MSYRPTDLLQHALEPIIPNDHQVFRVVIEKRLPPKQSGGFGHLKVSIARAHGLRYSKVRP